MARTITVIGSVQDGTLTLPPRWADGVKGWPDGRVELVVRHEKKDRTHRQLRYYWGRVLPLMAEATGQDAESIHDDMCERFLTRRRVSFVNPVTGEIEERDVSRRTTGLSTQEFFDFTEQVRIFAGEFLGLIVPPPEEGPIT